MRQIKNIVIHCSASRNGDDSIDHRVIDEWHRARGFNMIGYHYVILIDGSVERGRDEAEIGAHVQGSNAKSIGVCMVGTDKFTLEQWAALRELITSLSAKYPEAEVSGHRDFSPDLNGDGIVQPWEWVKTCPGFDVHAWLVRNMEPLPVNLCVPREGM